MPISTVGYAALKSCAPLVAHEYSLRDLHPDDVHIGVKFCGICHSDIHQVRDEWFPGTYPMVPGHEVLGVVKAVGSGVKNFKVGDRAAVGCMVDSCQNCPQCAKGDEHRCTRCVFTYNAKDKHGEVTCGGYGKDLICKENFVLKVPMGFSDEDLKFVAPLLCAGITVYSPMKRHGADRPGCRIGVMGMGGLGHMAVKFGVAFGNHVTVISRTKGKMSAAKDLGAHAFLVSTDAEQMKQAEGTLDFIIDTIAASKALEGYMALLDVGGVLACVGAAPGEEIIMIPAMKMIMGQKQIVGSCIGGIKETQDMLDFCAERKVLPMCEMIKAQDVNVAYERVVKSDVQFRFVIDHEGSTFA